MKKKKIIVFSLPSNTEAVPALGASQSIKSVKYSNSLITRVGASLHFMIMLHFYHLVQ